jgi:hypothetical protein
MGACATRVPSSWPTPAIPACPDHVPGEPFHQWRERVRPTAAQLVDIFIEVVRGGGPLHRRGVFIRDFKSEHVIVPADHKPVMPPRCCEQR